MVTGSAPGKIILFGEHAVVYGRPAIAVPVTQVQATATVTAAAAAAGLTLALPDVAQHLALAAAPDDHPLAHVIRLTLAALELPPAPDWTVTVRSTVPPASGLGSGAAVATAIVRALARAAGQSLTPAQVSALVYESERLFHGTPSGVDNTVVAFEQPVWFVRGRPAQPFAELAPARGAGVGRPFTVIIADTGIASPTRATVGDVRRGWQADPARYEALFDAVGRVVHAARQAIVAGDVAGLGPLMNENHRLLQDMGVSCPELDALQAAARAAGAPGAKLSGGGRGGNLIALAPLAERGAEPIAAELARRGAVRTLMTRIGEPLQSQADG